MSDRKREDSGQFIETVTFDAIRGVVDQVPGPAITSSDIAEALDCTTEAARQKLGQLVERGELEKRKTGRTTLYWRARDAEANSPDDNWVYDPADEF